jgi:hypothetical protein
MSDEELNALKDRISQMSDNELLKIVEVECDDYRKEAVEFAEVELAKRNIPFERPELDADEDEDDEGESAPPSLDEPCVNCGGIMRSGLLFADKELTILFSDTNEERFVNAYACSSCGDVRLIADLSTDVEG